MLSSVYSDDTGSVGKRKSLLSFLRKSYSRGSPKLQKNSQSRNQSPACEKKTPENTHHGSLPDVELEAILAPGEDKNMVHENVNNMQLQKLHRKIATATSPNEFRRKIHSHPSASSPTSRVRSKRSAFKRRQMAIDQSHEENFTQQRKSLVDFQFNHSSILENINKRCGQ